MRKINDCAENIGQFEATDKDKKKAVELEIVTFERRMWCAFNIILHRQHCHKLIAYSLSLDSFADPSASRLSTHKLEFMIPPDRKVERDAVNMLLCNFQFGAEFTTSWLKKKYLWQLTAKLLQHVEPSNA